MEHICVRRGSREALAAGHQMGDGPQLAVWEAALRRTEGFTGTRPRTVHLPRIGGAAGGTGVPEDRGTGA